MLSVRRLALVALAAVALFAAPHRAGADPTQAALTGWVHYYDGGIWIGGESDPSGWVVSVDRNPNHDARATIAYLDASAAGINLADFANHYATVRGSLDKDALSAGGVETPLRTFDLLHVASVEAPGFVPPVVYRHAPRLERRLLADLDARAVDFGKDGTAAPAAPLGPDGRIDGRRRARVVALVRPPAGSADMYTELAFVDARAHRYWALRTGGFLAVTQWVGPFALPRHVAKVTNVGVVLLADGTSGR